MTKGLTEQQKKIALIAIVACAIIYADGTYMLKPQLRNLKGVSFRLKAAGASISQYNTNSAYYKNLQAELSALRSKHSGIERYVFLDADLPLFLDDVSKTAYSFGVKIMQVAPQAGAAQKEKDSAKSAASFYPLGLKFELSARYHQLGKFLSALELNPLIEVSSIKINAGRQRSASQTVELVLKVYVQKK